MRSKMWQKAAENNYRDVGWPQVAMHLQLPHFLVVFITLN